MNERGCYCEFYEKNPALLEKQGVPRGYCGFCNKCGKPGHVRHFPGAVPMTGSWCDRHYLLLSIFHPLGSKALLIYILVMIGFWVWFFFVR